MPYTRFITLVLPTVPYDVFKFFRGALCVSMDWLSSKTTRLARFLFLLHALLLYSPTLGFTPALSVISPTKAGVDSVSAAAWRTRSGSSSNPLGHGAFLVQPGPAADASSPSARRGLSRLSMSTPAPPVKPVSGDVEKLAEQDSFVILPARTPERTTGFCHSVTQCTWLLKHLDLEISASA